MWLNTLFSKKNGVIKYSDLIMLLVTFSILTPFLSSMLSVSLNKFGITFLYLAKDILLFFFLFYFVFHERIKFLFVDILILSFVVFSFGLLFFTDLHYNFIGTILELRGSIILASFFFVGRYASSKIVYAELWHNISSLVIIICLLGFVEYLFIDRDYLFDGLKKIAMTKHIEVDKIKYFSFNYIVKYGGISLKRMASIFLNPLSFAYFLILPVSFYFSKILLNKNTTKVDIVILVFVCVSIMLSYTRAVILGIYIGISFILIYLKKYSYLLLLNIISILALISPPFSEIFISTLSLNDGSSIGHYNAIIKSVNNVIEHPWGYGLGTAGPFAFFYSKNSLGGESQYLTVALSHGLFGLILFLLIPVFLFYYSFHAKDDQIKYTIQLSTLIWFVSSIFSEQWMGSQSSGLYWLTMGMFCNNLRII